MKIGLLGRKLGMTRVYDANGKATPVTVIEAGGNAVLQVKNPERDGYAAVQVGFDSQKESRVSKPLLGHFKKANSEPKKFVREFRLPYGFAVDGDLDLSVSQFEAGQFCYVVGRSKGKGLQGVVKKHQVCSQPAADSSKRRTHRSARGYRTLPKRS